MRFSNARSLHEGTIHDDSDSLSISPSGCITRELRRVSCVGSQHFPKLQGHQAVALSFVRRLMTACRVTLDMVLTPEFIAVLPNLDGHKPLPREMPCGRLPAFYQGLSATSITPPLAHNQWLVDYEGPQWQRTDPSSAPVIEPLATER